MTTRRDVGTAIARLYDLLLPVIVDDDRERGEMRYQMTLAIIADGKDKTVNGHELGGLWRIARRAEKAAALLLQGIDDGSSVQRDKMPEAGITDDDLAAFRDDLEERIENLRAAMRRARTMQAITA